MISRRMHFGVICGLYKPGGLQMLDHGGPECSRSLMISTQMSIITDFTNTVHCTSLFLQFGVGKFSIKITTALNIITDALSKEDSPQKLTYISSIAIIVSCLASFRALYAHTRDASIVLSSRTEPRRIPSSTKPRGAGSYWRVQETLARPSMLIMKHVFFVKNHAGHFQKI